MFTNDDLIKKGLTNESEFFFVNKIIELFNPYANPSDRVRYGNTHSLWKEQLSLVKHTLDGYGSHLYDLLEEFQQSIGSDFVLENRNPKLKRFIQNTITEFTRNKKDEFSLKRYEIVLKRYVEDIENSYYTWCSDVLLDELKKNKKNYKTLDLIINNWATELINKNFSVKYIWEKINHLIVNSDNLDVFSFIRSFTCINKEYIVILPIESVTDNIRKNFKTINDYPKIFEYEETLSQYKNVVGLEDHLKKHINYFSDKVIACDYQSAIQEVINKNFNLFNNLFNYNNMKKMKIDNSLCIAISDKNIIELTRYTSLHFNKLYKDKKFYEIFHFFKGFQEQKHNINVFMNFSKILNFINPPINLDYNLTYSFLSSWIGLESCFESYQSSDKFSKIKDLFPLISMSEFSYNYFKDFRLLLNSLKYNYKNSKNGIIEMLHDISNGDIFNSFVENEYLRFKLNIIQDWLKSSKNFSNRLKSHVRNVEKQLRRIYVIRNNIVHNGENNNVSELLYSNLFDYLVGTLRYIERQLSGPKINTWDDIYVIVKQNSEEILFQLNNNITIDEIISVIM